VVSFPGKPVGWSRGKAKRKSNKGGASDRAHHRELFELAAQSEVDLIVGIDPDCKNVGMGGFEVLHGPSWVATTHVKDLKAQQAGPEVFRQCREALTEADNLLSVTARVLVIVEGMRIRRAQSDAATKNPQSLVDVSFCGGMAAGAALSVWPDAIVVVAEPQTWKGGVPKEIHHARLLDSLGWDYEVMSGYARPTGEVPVAKLSKINKADWKHVMDGIGLALWGQSELKKAAARLRREAGRK